MTRVYKYELEDKGITQVFMPSDAKFLKIAAQSGKICLWAEVDPDSVFTTRRFEAVTTGSIVTSGPVGSSHYMGTVLLDDGDYVLHYYLRA